MKTNEARKILFNCPESALRTYISRGIIKKSEKIGPGRNAARVFDVEELAYLRENPHLLRA
jgi:DNA-binding transcriptional MerR regulator